MTKDFGVKKWIQLHFKVKAIRKAKRPTTESKTQTENTHVNSG